MAYNSSKGPQTHGDVQYEGDPAETQIDFENDFIALKTSGSQVLVVSGSRVGIGMSTPGIHPNEKNDLVIGNQTGNRGMTIASAATGMSTIRFTYATNANNGEGWIDYSNNNKKMRIGTNGLNTRVTISADGTDIVGQLSASLGVTGSSLHTATTVIDATHVSSSLPVSASSFWVDGVEVGGMSSFTLAGDGGSSQAITNGNTLTVAGGTGLSSTAAATDTVTVKLDDTSVSAGSYTYSAITVDAQGRLTAASSGTGPAITTYSNAADNRVITSVNATSVQGEANLTHDGNILKSIGQISASLGVSGSTGHFRILNASSIVGGSPLDISASSVTITGSVTLSGSGTISASAGYFTTVTASAATISALTASAVSGGSPISIYGDTITVVGGGAGSTIITSAHLSSSLHISGTAFYGDGSTLTGVGAGTMSSWTLSADGGSNQAITDGNTVDIAGGTGITTAASATDTVTVNLDDTSVSAGSYTYSAITVDAQGRLTAASSGTGPAITTYSNAADNRVITSVNATSVQGEANLTHDGNILKSIGQISASLGVSGSTGHFGILNASSIVGASPLEISASSITVTGSLTFSGSSTVSASAGYYTTVTASTATISALTASAVSGGSPISIYGDTITLVGGGAGSTAITSAHLSSSLHISGAAFYGDGTTLTGVGPGTMSSWTLSADGGSNQAIADGNTVDIAGGTGITTAASATDTVTVNLDDTSVSAGSYTYSAITVDAQGRLTAASSGTGPSITTLNSAAANRLLTSDGGASATAEERLTFDSSTKFLFLSGNAQITNHLPYIFFSNSAGTGLGYMGYNSSNNILFQNNTSNKHIVFKTNDNGNIKEGFRIDGAVPEVVVNQGSESLIDFRVESDNNSHMLYVAGVADKVGVNSNTPTHTLSVTGTFSVSSTAEVTGALRVGGKTSLYNHMTFTDPTTLSANAGLGEVAYYGSEHGTDTLAAGKLMYLSGSSTGSFWRYADADAEASAGPVQLGVALGTAVTDGILLRGYFHAGTLGDSSTFVTGGTCYVGLAAGTISFTRPSAVGDVIRAIGHGIAAEKVIYFNPSYDWFQL